MACVICHEDCKEIYIPVKSCECNFIIHQKCFNNLVEKSKIKCIYCREKVINRETLFLNYYFDNNQSTIIALSWYFISYIITFGLIVPFLISNLFVKFNEYYIINFTKRTIIFLSYYYLIFTVIKYFYLIISNIIYTHGYCY